MIEVGEGSTELLQAAAPAGPMVPFGAGGGLIRARLERTSQT